MLFDPKTLLVFFTAIPVGVMAILVGGTMFLSIPLFQLLFPNMAMGALIGNFKVGSVVRDIVASYVLRKKIVVQKILPIIIAFLLGSALGAFGVADLSQAFVLPAIIIGILLAEFAQKISANISRKTYLIVAFAVGVFGGILGAGISVLIIALLRVKNPKDEDIHVIRAEAVFLELTINAMAVLVFLTYGKLSPAVFIPWAAGSFVGGTIGSHLLHKTGRLSPRFQKNLLRAVFVFALVIALWKAI